MISINMKHLGIYSDLIDWASASSPGDDPRRMLSSKNVTDAAATARVVSKTCEEGLICEKIEWNVGYGPNTEAFLLYAETASGPLPGIIALHDHSGFKFFGKEKIVSGPWSETPILRNLVNSLYGGQFYANYFARHGFAVLVPDVFLWGSRRFPLETMDDFSRKMGHCLWQSDFRHSDPGDIALYNACAIFHENVVQKYLSLLNLSLAGLLLYEDGVATKYLRSRQDRCNGVISSVGVSGGGLRSFQLYAQNPDISNAVVTGMMSTYQGLMSEHVFCHTWALFPQEICAKMDWPDQAARATEKPLLVQYLEDDNLFGKQGMQEADLRLQKIFAQGERPENYTAEFWPGDHRFDPSMQRHAAKWLGKKAQNI